MMKSLLWSILLLPGTVTAFAPAALLIVSVVFFRMTIAFSENIMVPATSIVFFVIGLLLALTTNADRWYWLVRPVRTSVHPTVATSAENHYSWIYYTLSKS